jgi:hypothetical protein
MNSSGHITLVGWKYSNYEELCRVCWGMLCGQEASEGLFSGLESDETKYCSFKTPYFSIDNAHLMYNAHAKFFRHSFSCIDNAHDAN